MTEDGVTEVEEWIVTWFPPDKYQRQKTFKGDDAEQKAREHAATGEVAEWNPLLEHRITRSLVVSELVPL